MLIEVFSRGHATLHLAVSVGRSRTFLNSEQFLHYCSYPTVRNWIAVYLALFKTNHRVPKCTINGSAHIFAGLFSILVVCMQFYNCNDGRLVDQLVSRFIGVALPFQHFWAFFAFCLCPNKMIGLFYQFPCPHARKSGLVWD